MELENIKERTKYNTNVLYDNKMIFINLMIIFFFLFSVIIYFKIKKHQLNTKMLLLIFILLFINSGISNLIISNIPLEFDLVTIRATGEKHEKAQGNEIWIKQIKVDNKGYQFDNVCDGKWISTNGYLGWRGYDCSSDVTDKITIKVPKGINRNIQFESNIWRGIAEINAGGKNQRIDFYNDNQTSKNVKLSCNVDILKRVIVINGIISALLGLIEFILYKKRKKINKFCKKNREHLIYIGISLIGFLVTFIISKNEMFWGDELGSVLYSSGTLKDAIQYSSFFYEYNPPLFSMIGSLWYRLVPYGERWLLLLPMILTYISVYIIAVTSHKITGFKAGLIASIMAILSSQIIINIAQEFRPYALMFFCASGIEYCYWMKSKNEKNRNRFKSVYIILLVAITYTHNFGILLYGLYFIWDIGLYIAKKIQFKDLLPYIYVGVLFLPRAFQIINAPYRPTSNYPAPSFESFYSVIFFLCSKIEFILILFLISTAIIILNKSFDIFYKKSVFIIWGMLALVMVVGLVIPNMNLMNPRFFIAVLPQVYLILAVALNKIYEDFDLLLSHNICKGIAIGLALYIMITCMGNVINDTEYDGYDFRSVANYLLQQDDIHDETTAVTSITWGNASFVIRGMKEFYLEHGGRLPKVNIIDGGEIKKENLSNVLKYNKMYICTIQGEFNSEQDLILGEYYKLIGEEKDLKIYEKK